MHGASIGPPGPLWADKKSSAAFANRRSFKTYSLEKHTRKNGTLNRTSDDFYSRPGGTEEAFPLCEGCFKN